MNYIIKYANTQKVFNIQHYGIDLFNVGINPKIYKTEAEALKDISLFDSLKQKQLQICFNTQQGLKDHGKPSWYEQRATKKLTKREMVKLEWYENALAMAEKKKLFTESLEKSDLVLEELT